MTITETSSRRNLNLDLLKSLSILLVIIIHNCYQLKETGYLDNQILLLVQAAVPCFFMASGALSLRRTDPLKKHLLRTLHFYLVYVVWRMLYLVFFHLYAGLPLPGERDLIHFLLFFGNLEGVATSHFWYMDAMVMIMLITPVLRYCFQTNRTLFYYLIIMLFVFENGLCAANQLLSWITALLKIPGFSIADLGAVNPLHFNYSMGILYYMLGAVLYENRTRYPIRWILLTIVISMAVLTLVRYSILGTFRNIGGMIPSGYFRVSTLTLGAALMILCLNIPLEKAAPLRTLARFSGTATQGIFYMHIPLLMMLHDLEAGRTEPFHGVILCLGESLLVLLTATLITQLLRKIPLLQKLV